MPSLQLWIPTELVWQDGKGNLKPVTWLDKESKFVNGVYSYQKGTSYFFDEGKQLIFPDNDAMQRC